MSNWKGITAKAFTQAGFTEYCKEIGAVNWKPQFVVLHNTGSPTLAQRPDGLTLQHIHNLEGYYRDTQGWSAGPHLFVDDKQIWVFTPLNVHGVHSPSWNDISFGVEMLGDYQNESFTDGRGALVRENAASAIATLCKQFYLSPDTLRLHKEDTRTTHQCPGKNVVKEDFIAEVKKFM